MTQVISSSGGLTARSQSFNAEMYQNVVIGTNPVDADARRRVAKADIASRRESQLSSMPEGLLNTLSRDEVLDLVAWLIIGETPRPASPR